MRWDDDLDVALAWVKGRGQAITCPTRSKVSSTLCEGGGLGSSSRCACYVSKALIAEVSEGGGRRRRTIGGGGSFMPISGVTHTH